MYSGSISGAWLTNVRRIMANAPSWLAQVDILRPLSQPHTTHSLNLGAWGEHWISASEASHPRPKEGPTWDVAVRTENRISNGQRRNLADKLYWVGLSCSFGRRLHGLFSSKVQLYDAPAVIGRSDSRRRTDTTPGLGGLTVRCRVNTSSQ
ncbi:hypothetical protein CC85DRAFT_282800 [Cutaneotrichosporon oleaginosum]|uniref:Uncharacterized protein n=1 Tax=Cutaneotrichosporon oleaginosum TaxID=879819 RepID=A0A0J0XW50_9TREE|nr:uncharacterized protein CC85DRAFT_282800 [Cutaneotrichosporon oleaginosum]KLT45317.1 hypothetical protein CC85DRAFT_282800 [Cutaneotrichosporon oleaginosum]TXT14854.1 hypothetical protein COLE_01047 [Cutaneotrichosporon oleaginosum]